MRVFGRSVNPISTGGGAHYTHLFYVPSRIFRPWGPWGAESAFGGRTFDYSQSMLKKKSYSNSLFYLKETLCSTLFIFPLSTNYSKIEDIELGVGNLSLREDLNPFDTDIHSRLLKMIPQPVEKRHGFVDLRGEKLPNIRPHSNVMIGDSEFFCMECKGK